MSELAELIKDHVSSGCTHVASLGITQMPEGYALMLDHDDMYYYWLNDHGESGEPHWNRWAVYRGAKARRERMSHRLVPTLPDPPTPAKPNTPLQ